MSRFMSKAYQGLKAYVPGEQPKNMTYVKLNTNESPFPPSSSVVEAVQKEAGRLQLYSDPECRELVQIAADFYGVNEQQLIMTNGSDEALEYIFQTFGDKSGAFVFPDITYGFYPVFAQLYSVPYEEIPLQSDFTIDAEAYNNIGRNIVIANPNAQTGIALDIGQIEKLVASNREHIVAIDEAYIDFGGETAIPLLKEYDNLLVIRTFSKSYSLAGARLGVCIANEEVIKDLNMIKYSKNPYNVNRMTMAAGIAALKESEYYLENCKTIMNNREAVKKSLYKRGFDITDSDANFILISHEKISGKQLFEELKAKGYLVRHLDMPRLKNYNRITIGTEEQMSGLIGAIDVIMEDDYEKQ